MLAEFTSTIIESDISPTYICLLAGKEMFMKESIIEFKIKGYIVKVDNTSLSIYDKSELLLKVNYQQINAITKWIILKVNELKDSP